MGLCEIRALKIQRLKAPALGSTSGILKSCPDTNRICTTSRGKEKLPEKTTGACRKMWGEDGNGMRPIKLNTE